MAHHSHSDESTLTVGHPDDHAAGLTAVQKSLAYGAREMGPLRTRAVFAKLNQIDGFDCPSCAWPEDEHRTPFEFCENGAKASSWEATTKVVGPEFFAEHSVADLEGRSDHWLEAQGRLVAADAPRGGRRRTTRRLSWDRRAAHRSPTRCKALPDPNRAIFYTSGRTSNEAAFLYQLFVRRFGTNNLPDCSNMCHESSGVALTRDDRHRQGHREARGHHRLLGPDRDRRTEPGHEPPAHADVPGEGEAARRPHRRRSTRCRRPGSSGSRTRRRRVGSSAGERRSATSSCRSKLGGDQALFALTNRLLLEAENAAPGTVLDRGFLERYTAGYDAAAEYWRGLSVPDVLAQTGLSMDQVQQLVDETLRARSIIVCWAMGVTQQPNAVATIEEMTNYLLLRGNMGRPGAGVCPVRGHSNVQGDRTMGIFEQMPESFLASLDAEFGFTSPREHGVDAVNAIRAMRDGKADVFMAVGGNFAQATPDTEVTHQALRNVGLSVQVSTKLNRSHLVHGTQALILPCLGRTDRGRHRRRAADGHRRGLDGHGAREPRPRDAVVARAVVRGGDSLPARPGHTRPRGSHPVGRLRSRLLPDSGPDRSRHPRLRELQRQDRQGRRVRAAQRAARHLVVPDLNRSGQLPDHPTADARAACGPPDAADAAQPRPVQHHDLRSRRSLPRHPRRPAGGLPERRRHRRTGLRRRRSRRPGRGVVRRRAARRVFRIVAYETPRGTAAAYYPETNVLVPLDSTAAESNQPASKAVVVRLERSPAPVPA